jgi:rhodanese-related sulfurtransferase
MAVACGKSASATAADPGTEAAQWVESGATLLDVRTPGEFAGGHVRGAINIPVQDLAQRVDELPAGRVVVYCQSGGRSANATRTLRASQREVLDLGGIGNWPRRADIVR